MGLFDNTVVDKGIASLFSKKLSKDDLAKNNNETRDVVSSKTKGDAPAVAKREAAPRQNEASESSSEEEASDHGNLEDNYVRKVAAKSSGGELRAMQVDEEDKESSEDAEEDQEEVATNSESKTIKANKSAKNTSTDADVTQDDLERTLFVKNVPNSVITDRKMLKAFKTLFGPGIKSVRFRSIALSEIVPRKVGFIKQKLNTTRDSVNSYIVYDSVERVKDAMRTKNGVEFEDHHLFVDSAAKPRAQASKRSVFIGNLSFDATEEQLFRMFEDVGGIENLRIVRDRKFNIGKGFAYIQFDDVSTVQLALLKNDKEFDGRKLRVTRCSKPTAKPDSASAKPVSKHGKSPKSFKQKQTKRSKEGNTKAKKEADSGAVLEGTRSKPGDSPHLNRKRKARHENGRAAGISKKARK